MLDIPGATRQTLFGGSVLLRAYGKYYPDISGKLEVQDWALRSFRKNGDAKKDHSVTKYLPEIGRQIESKIFLAPSPKMSNTKICTASELTEHIGITSPIYENSAWLWRGADADGIVVGKGDAVVISPGGCPAFAVLDEERGMLGIGHGSRDALIDHSRIRRKWLRDRIAEPREHESVVDSLLKAMYIKSNADAKRLQVCIAFPINPAIFTHPWKSVLYGKLNRARSEDLAFRGFAQALPGFDDKKLREEGRLDLGILASLQFQSHGVSEQNITILDAPGEDVWYTTRSTHGDETQRDVTIFKYL